MSAVERIKEIDSYHSGIDLGDHTPRAVRDMQYMIRAYKKMRDIAIKEWSENSRWPNGDEAIDELFEEAMKDQ